MEIMQVCDQISFYRKKYDGEILKKFHMENFKDTTTPMNPKERFRKDDATDQIDE